MHRTSCVDIMTRHVGNSSTRATGYMYILCLEKTGSELFYQFLSQDFLKMVNDRTGSVRDVGSRLLSQSIAIDLCVLIDGSSIDRYQSIPINFIDWFSDHQFPSIGYPGYKCNQSTLSKCLALSYGLILY